MVIMELGVSCKNVTSLWAQADKPEYRKITASTTVLSNGEKWNKIKNVSKTQNCTTSLVSHSVKGKRAHLPREYNYN